MIRLLEEVENGTLTPREHQVAEQVVLGFSTPYVAAKLHISKRTVEAHLRHVYEKLDVTCRDDFIERYGWACGY